METVTDFILLGSKITADGDCSHEYRKAMTNLDSILKGRDITFWQSLLLCCLVKAMVFPVVLYGSNSSTIQKAECQRIDIFELWCLRRLLRIPWTARRSNQSILRKSDLNTHWNDWWWSSNSNTLTTWCKELTHLKRPWCWERLRAGGEGDNRGRYGWMASWTWGAWVWASSRRWWRRGMPSVLMGMGSQRIRHNWVTEQQQKKTNSFSLHPWIIGATSRLYYLPLVQECPTLVQPGKIWKIWIPEFQSKNIWFNWFMGHPRHWVFLKFLMWV